MHQTVSVCSPRLRRRRYTTPPKVAIATAPVPTAGLIIGVACTGGAPPHWAWPTMTSAPLPLRTLMWTALTVSTPFESVDCSFSVTVTTFGIPTTVFGEALAVSVRAGRPTAVTLPAVMVPLPVAPDGVALQVALTPVSEAARVGPRLMPSCSTVAEAEEVPLVGSPAV